MITAATHSTTVAISVISASGDQVVRGLSDAGMQRRVLMEEYDQQLTLHRTLQICQAYEASRAQVG